MRLIGFRPVGRHDKAPTAWVVPRTLIWCVGVTLVACGPGSAPGNAEAGSRDGSAKEGPRIAFDGLNVHGDAGRDGDTSVDGTFPSVSAVRGRLAAGDDFTCALARSGRIVCWGMVAAASTPSADGFVFIAAGARHACAIDRAGVIKCWNARGLGEQDVERDIPTGRFREVAVGGDRQREYACAIDLGGSIRCWRSGLLSPAADVTTPPSEGQFDRIDLSSTHGCGLRIDATVRCWGPSSLDATNAPKGPFLDMAVGPNFSCALNTMGRPVCWGVTSIERDFPMTFRGSLVAASTTGFGDRTCILLDLGRVWCSGGHPGAPDRSVVFREVSVGVGHVCAVTREDAVHCWSTAPSNAVTSVPAGLLVLAR
jgi:hypothetical protein